MPTKLSNFLIGIGCFSLVIGIGFFFYFLINKSILTAFLYVISSLFILIIFASFSAAAENKRKEQQKNLISTFQPNDKDFQETQSFISFDLLSKVTMDEKHKRIYLWTPENKDIQMLKNVYYGMPYQLFTYEYSDILAIELLEDNTLISTISRRSKSAFFLLDGLQTIQAKAPGEPSIKKVHAIELKIIVNDRVKPIHIIRFYSDPTTSLQKGSAEYQKVQNDIEHWVTVLNLIIKEADQEEGVHHNDKNGLNKSNTPSSEITKLKELHVEKHEKKRIAKIQLLSVLNQIISIKLNDEEPMQSIRNTDSYFDQLLEKNREQLRGDSNKV